MVDSTHLPTHADHDDPAELLASLIARGEISERTWSEGSRIWSLERIAGEDGGTMLVLTLLNHDHTLVCQATASLEG